MSPVGTTNVLVIETRRTVRAKAAPLKNDRCVNSLGTDLGTPGRDGDNSQPTWRLRNLSRPVAERDVPFRHSASAPRLNAAFVAQLLGQAMPDNATSPSGARAAYEHGIAPAPVCDRRL
jgi:hypothetical protein